MCYTKDLLQSCTYYGVKSHVHGTNLSSSVIHRVGVTHRLTTKDIRYLAGAQDHSFQNLLTFQDQRRSVASIHARTRELGMTGTHMHKPILCPTQHPKKTIIRCYSIKQRHFLTPPKLRIGVYSISKNMLLKICLRFTRVLVSLTYV